MQTAWPFPPLCGWALRQRVKVTDAPALVSDTKAYLRSKVKDDAVDPSPVKEPLPDDSETAADDARTLTVDYDDQGERYKAWRDVCRECKEYGFPDWPHEGPQTTLHILKHMQKNRGSPKLWLQVWSRFKGAREGAESCTR